jgi:TolA-binding protein
MEHLSLIAASAVALLLGAVLGYAWSQRSIREQQAQLKKRLAHLEQIKKAAGERVAQMRDQIAGLNKTVTELRQIQGRLEADKRRRDMVDRALEGSPFDKKDAQDDSQRKGPPSTFADTEVLG